MTLLLGNGAVLKGSNQNNSGHELFIFKILLIAID